MKTLRLVFIWLNLQRRSHKQTQTQSHFILWCALMSSRYKCSTGVMFLFCFFHFLHICVIIFASSELWLLRTFPAVHHGSGQLVSTYHSHLRLCDDTESIRACVYVSLFSALPVYAFCLQAPLCQPLSLSFCVFYWLVQNKSCPSRHIESEPGHYEHTAASLILRKKKKKKSVVAENSFPIPDLS